MKELDEIHSANELSIMDMFHSIEKTVERMEDSCHFTERILEHGNGVEVLSLQKHISIQLLMLLNNIPRPEPSVKIEFHTDVDKFGTMVKMAFGRFKRPDELNRVGLTTVAQFSFIKSVRPSCFACVSFVFLFQSKHILQYPSTDILESLPCDVALAPIEDLLCQVPLSLSRK